MFTDKGLKRETYAEILQRMKNNAIALFGYDFNTTDSNPMVNDFAITADEIAKLWEMGEWIYLSHFVQYAVGVSLDRLGSTLFNVTRKSERKAVWLCEFTGTNGYIVSKGFKVSTIDNIIFETIEDFTIGEETTLANVIAIEGGSSGNVAVGDINLVLNPTVNVTSVVNVDEIFYGSNKENDVEYRQRIMRYKDNAGTGTTNAILGGIMALEGVDVAKLIENDMNTPDIYENPPHSIHLYVIGSEAPENICQALLDKKAAGIVTVGSIWRDVKDISGDIHRIHYDNGIFQSIYIRITVYTRPQYVEGNHNIIINNLVKYIGGVDLTAERWTGLNMGEDVVISKCIDAFYNDVVGVADIKIEVSKDGVNWQDTNLTIAPIEKANTEPMLITITTTPAPFI